MPSATDRMERAENSLKRQGLAHTSIVSEVEIRGYLAKETGKDRVVKMFSRKWVDLPSMRMRVCMCKCVYLYVRVWCFCVDHV